MLAKKYQSIAELNCSELPTLIKCAQFERLVGFAKIEEKIRADAESIIEEAKTEAQRIVQEASVNTDERVEAGYKAGLEKAQLEMAAKMTDMAASSAHFMREVESRLVDIVSTSMTEIVSGFDDRELVLETVRRAAASFQSSGSVTLWVAPELHDQFDMGIAQLVAPAALLIKSDERLSGGQCRMENGHVVVIGNSQTQVEAVRTALKSKFKQSGSSNCH